MMRHHASPVTRFVGDPSASATPRVVGAALRGVVWGAAALALAACASGPRAGGASSSGGAGGSTLTTPSGPVVDPSGPVLVALLAPTTAGSDGVRQAAQDIVAAAQLARSELAPASMNLKVYDTRGTGPGAAAAASQAVGEGAALILGPLLGASADEVRAAARPAGVNVLAFTNDQRAAGGNLWALGQLPGDEMRRLFSYAGSRGVGSVAVVYPTDSYGRAVASDANGAARDAGIGVGPVMGYERSFVGIESASGEAALAIRSSGVGGVLIADAGDALRSMSAFLTYRDVSRRAYQFMGLSRWADAGNTSESSLSGGWFVAVDPARKAAFDARFRSTMSRDPGRVASVGYDAVAAAAAMLRAASVGGPPAFSRGSIVNGAGYEGATGRFALLEDGTNRRSLAVLEVTPSGFNVLDPAPGAAPGS